MSLQQERWRVWRNVLRDEQVHDVLEGDFYNLGRGFYVHTAIGQTGYVVLVAFRTNTGQYRSKYYAVNVRSSPLRLSIMAEVMDVFDVPDAPVWMRPYMRRSIER